ncbi:endonuclease/exonuclease/phosphatase family protein [Dongia rigui]|uniref:Endonuclease/exonuclease/phosphatase family protein n=1 Tax=Dongia rigui TaxID=940149 RepID=A0ABU5DYV5_9PROT|nr:endonuclease/exonuclease/phosphatase family protein [Dongia rigui]MDY0872471.1 endonuclease/exonuclease/phosphatase family protein [Dongia rigui]
MKKLHWVALLLAALLISPGRGRAEDTQTLRIMTFNIFLGGDQVSFAKVIEAIKASKADIVALQEAEGHTREIADALGWPYAVANRNVISRLPLFAPPTAIGPDGNDLNYLFAEITPGKFVAVADVHLPSDPYGPYAFREGKSAEEVMKLEEETRLPAITAYIEPLKKLADSGVPVVVLGDFNSPSHLDWTKAMVGKRPQITAPMDWPASKALADAGFTDAYRAVHPDPVAKPGITWSYGYPFPHLDANEALDRIDLIQVAGPAKTTAAEIAGDPKMPDTDIPVSPWPSDHRAVTATLDVTPGPVPAMVSIEPRSVKVGDMVRIRFHAATEDGRYEGGRIAVIADGGDVAAPLLSLYANNGTDRASSQDLGTAGLAPGAYQGVMLGADGKELARAPFWVVARDAMPTLATDKADYAAGEPVVARWANAPGNRFDWLGLFAKGDPAEDNYQQFFYINSAVAGSLTLDKDLLGDALAAGDYELRLMRDDAYARLAVAAFTVK